MGPERLAELRDHWIADVPLPLPILETRLFIRGSLLSTNGYSICGGPPKSVWCSLTWLSHMLDCQLFGLEPGRQRVTNLFLHIVNALLLFIVLRRMTGQLWQSAFVAALFALHPLHVESVAWISERKDVLSAFFWMLTMLAYVRYAEVRGLAGT